MLILELAERGDTTQDARVVGAIVMAERHRDGTHVEGYGGVYAGAAEREGEVGVMLAKSLQPLAHMFVYEREVECERRCGASQS